MIKGIKVKLINLIDSGNKDDFNNPIFSETQTDVDNVLVAPSSSQEILDSTNLYGKKAVYTLGIPKGDSHIWENQYVEFFGQRWHCFGFPTMGIEANIPLQWNMKVMVEKYNESSD